MRRLIVMSGLIAGLAAAPVLAQTMNAEAFHRRATKLQNKGAVAIFSMGEIKKLAAEGGAAARKARETRLAAVAAGRKPRYCPPEAPQSMNSSEFMTRLSAIPAPDRARIDMTEATTRILAVKFPC